MRRSRLGNQGRGNQGRDNQGSAASLFPFLAVLLCTLGAMVVLLVAMAHVSRQKAEHEAELQAAAAEAADTPEQQLARQRLAEAKAYRDRLDEVRSEAAVQLEEEQIKLTGIEDHIRRLQEEVRSLQTEAQELFALEEEHYDDQAMAEQELERLHKLTETLTEEIAELEEEAAGRQRRYAIVPMRDEATGTHRPAVYFECRSDGVVLQPEGIRLTREDFFPPVHVSSPLAAAVRSINQYYADHPEARGVGEVGAPYPLLVVRPDGISAYHAARTVLESINGEYGYQPVAKEWPLEYESPNPIMAEQVADAIELARAERKRLSAAAPQLFRKNNPGWAWSKGRGGSPAASQGSLQSSFLGTGGDSDSDNPFAGVRLGSSVEGGRVGSSTTEGRKNGEQQGEAYGFHANPPGPTGGLPSIDSSAERSLATSSDQQNPYFAAEADSGESSTGQASAAGGSAGQGADVNEAATAAGSPSAPTAPSQNPSEDAQQVADNDNQRPGIPMRRSIELTVYADRIVFASGQTIELTGPHRTHAQQVAAALKKHADTWGIAGQGFYWKPSLTLHTTPDGQPLANQLVKQLRRAGIQVSQQSVANTATKQGGQDASQRR